MTADELKARLYARHPGHGGQMPGAWTVIEEWRQIDVLAFSAWSSQGNYARIGYEVKVSRSDLRRELLAPHKRAANVEWCNEFYFAVPSGLLTKDELAFVEPDWPEDAFKRDPCPRRSEYPWRRRGRCQEQVPVPRVVSGYESYSRDWGSSWEYITCSTCGGKGYVAPSMVEREAPTCWVPKDVGLVEVDGRGTRVVRRSPRRKDVPEMGPMVLGQFVRWVSMRPDTRHHPSRADSLTLVEIQDAV